MTLQNHLLLLKGNDFFFRNGPFEGHIVFRRLEFYINAVQTGRSCNMFIHSSNVAEKNSNNSESIFFENLCMNIPIL